MCYNLDDTHIASLDANGVALASIQALRAQNEAQATHLDALEKENAGLRQQLDALDAESDKVRQQLDALESRLSALEAGGPAGRQSRSPFGGVRAAWLLGGLLAVGCVVAVGRRKRARGES